MTMAGGSLAPVMVGIMAGVIFVAMFSLFQQKPAAFHNNTVTIDTSGYLEGRDRPQLTNNERLVLEVLSENATVRDLLHGRDVYIIGIADMGERCGENILCARVHLGREGSQKDQMQLMVDYLAHKVTRIDHTDGW